jgi:hypothetical protein
MSEESWKECESEKEKEVGHVSSNEDVRRFWCRGWRTTWTSEEDGVIVAVAMGREELASRRIKRVQRLRVRVRGVRPNRVWVRDSELVVWQARMVRDERVVKHWRLVPWLVGLMTRRRGDKEVGGLDAKKVSKVFIFASSTWGGGELSFVRASIRSPRFFAYK